MVLFNEKYVIIFFVINYRCFEGDSLNLPLLGERHSSYTNHITITEPGLI